MSDLYEAAYNAVSNKIHNTDIGNAVERAIENANISHKFDIALQVFADYSYPSVLYRPKLFIDGNQWCALYGENLQEGVAGFGSSPAEAVQSFNHAWFKKLQSSVKEAK